MLLPYVPDLYTYHRRATRVVMVGNVAVGGDNPIRVQSMTTTLTKDVPATVAQVERLVAAGCEIVRITTPTPADARCLEPIRQELLRRGVAVPLVADIHFSPAAALAAAEHADKVRINPGNYTDSRRFAVREYSDEQYADELARIEERFRPLVLKCKERGVSMRIGTNHGSLSDRIMNRFGDTPEGMVESALEFVRICETHAYHEIILSMKASNPKVMIAANRLLVARLMQLGMEYPLHLGVTEAGNADDGRIKSAIGIGSLLEDGMGDTIRVSLTEDPEEEVPVAFALAAQVRGREGMESIHGPSPRWNPYSFERRISEEVLLGDVPIGGSASMAVLAPIPGPLAKQKTALASILRWASPARRRDPKPDVAVTHLETDADVVVLRHVAARLSKWPQARLGVIAQSDDAPLLMDALPDVDAVMQTVRHGDDVTLLASATHDAGKAIVLEACVESGEAISSHLENLVRVALDVRAQQAPIILSIRSAPEHRIPAYRLLAALLHRHNLPCPILLQAEVGSEALLEPSIGIGAMLCDGIGDAAMVTGSKSTVDLTFNILQAAGSRIFKTDYVACPSCGRTLFDLQETTERIKQRTSHLVGVRLAIMGCIVNGPGEMADADFGYVGGAPGQVNLYVGKECVEKGVPAEDADDRLVALIKASGKWQEEDPED